MKALFIIGTFICFCFASGGDTIKYTADVRNLKDGDNFYSDIHYHSMKDSIANIVNGKLGNINIAADAEIDLSKLDTAGSMKFNTLTTDKHTSDTVIADTAKITAGNITKVTIDTSKTRHATSDSQTVPIELGNKTFRGNITCQDVILDSSDHRVITADSATISTIKGAKTIRDTTTFTGGAYFAGIARFAGTLYAPTAIMDSFSVINGAYFGGNIGIRTTSLAEAVNVNRAGANNVFIKFSNDNNTGCKTGITAGGAFEILNPANTAIIMSTNDTERMRITNDGNVGIRTGVPSTALDVNGTVKATAFSGPLTGNVTGNVSGSSGSCTGNAATATTATNVSGGTVSATTGTFSTGITIAGGSQLTAYDTGSFPCTLKTNAVTVQQIGTAYYTLIGNEVTISFPYLVGTSNSSALAIYTGIPSAILPKQQDGGYGTEHQSVVCIDNNTDYMGYIYIQKAFAYMIIKRYDNSPFQSSGTKGVRPFSTRYIIN